MSTRSSVHTSKFSSIDFLAIGSEYVPRLLKLQMCWHFNPFVDLLSRNLSSTEINSVELLYIKFMVLAL